MTKSAHIQAFHRKRPSSRTVGGRPDDSCRPLSQQIVALSFLDSSQASSVGGVSAQGDFVTSNQTFLGRAWHAETQSTVHSAPSQSSDATLRSSRDLEQGICEYVEKKLPVVDALGVSISLPVRLIGWMLRREGLFRHYKRRFCVFEADVSTLYIFANDDTSNHGRLLRQMVLTEVQLTSRHARSFYLQGYTQKRELHKKQSDTMAKRASSLSKKAMPGDMQRFYLPEEEILRAVSDRATSVWAQCFLNHMRLHRVRRQHQQARANNSATIPDEEDEDDDDELDSDDEDMNPDFTFIERGVAIEETRSRSGSPDHARRRTSPDRRPAARVDRDTSSDSSSSYNDSEGSNDDDHYGNQAPSANYGLAFDRPLRGAYDMSSRSLHSESTDSDGGSGFASFHADTTALLLGHRPLRPPPSEESAATPSYTTLPEHGAQPTRSPPRSPPPNDPAPKKPASTPIAIAVAPQRLNLNVPSPRSPLRRSNPAPKKSPSIIANPTTVQPITSKKAVPSPPRSPVRNGRPASKKATSTPVTAPVTLERPNWTQPTVSRPESPSRKDHSAQPESKKPTFAVTVSNDSEMHLTQSGMSSMTRGMMDSIWNDPHLQTHRVDFDAIKKVQAISRGAFGEVWRAKYRGQDVVVKHLKDASDKSRKEVQLFLREIRILSRLEHEKIVPFLGVAWTMELDMRLVMEYMPNGDLRSFLDRQKAQGVHQVGWNQTQWRLTIDIIEGLVYLHSLSPALVHCDLKSRNVLLDHGNRAKIADFGISRYLEEEGALSPAQEAHIGYCANITTALGTGRWMAPEILAGNEAELSQAADIYSFGILLSEIDTNELPFHDRMKTADGDSVNEDVLLHHVVADGWKPSFRVFCPEFIRSLAQECLQADPSKRPNSLDVAYRLRKAASKAASEWKRLPVPPALAAISE